MHTSAMGRFIPHGAGQGTEPWEPFPSREPLLAPQPESQGFVHLQPEVLDTGSRKKSVKRVIKHTYLTNDTKQRSASQNPFPGSVS